MHYCLLLIILSTAYFCFSFHGHLLLLLLHVKLIMTSHFSQRWTNYDLVLIITHQRRSKEEFLLFIIFLCGFTWVNWLRRRMTVGSNEFVADRRRRLFAFSQYYYTTYTVITWLVNVFFILTLYVKLIIFFFLILSRPKCNF